MEQAGFSAMGELGNIQIDSFHKNYVLVKRVTPAWSVYVQGSLGNYYTEIDISSPIAPIAFFKSNPGNTRPVSLHCVTPSVNGWRFSFFSNKVENGPPPNIDVFIFDIRTIPSIDGVGMQVFDENFDLCYDNNLGFPLNIAEAIYIPPEPVPPGNTNFNPSPIFYPPQSFDHAVMLTSPRAGYLSEGSPVGGAAMLRADGIDTITRKIETSNIVWVSAFGANYKQFPNTYIRHNGGGGLLLIASLENLPLSL